MSINRGGRRGWTRSVLAGFAVAAMAQAAFAVTTVAASGERFTYTGHCDDVVLIVAADMSVLGQYVPSPYVPLAGQSGKGAVAVTVCNGIHLAIDGTPIPDAVLTDLIVAISDPTGGTGETWYAIWQSGNSDPIRAKQAGLGEFGASVTGMTYSSTPASPGTTVTTTSVPWSYSPFAQTATSLNSPPQMAAKTNTFYQVGSLGTIAVANTFANETLDPAHGTVTAAPGSPLAAIMGATSADAEGFLLHIDFTQTESLQAPAGDVPEMPMPAIALAVSTLGVGLLRRIGRDHWMR